MIFWLLAFTLEKVVKKSKLINKYYRITLEYLEVKSYKKWVHTFKKHKMELIAIFFTCFTDTQWLAKPLGIW